MERGGGIGYHILNAHVSHSYRKSWGQGVVSGLGKEVDRMTRISLGNLWQDNILKPALFKPLRKWHQIFSERRQDGTSRHQGWALRFGFFNKHTANSFTNNRVKIWNIGLNMKCYGSINQSVFHKKLVCSPKGICQQNDLFGTQGGHWYCSFALITLGVSATRALWLKMTFEQTAGGSAPGSPGDEADVGEVVTMVDVLKDGRDMEENAKVQNSKYQRSTYFRRC